MAKIVECVPNFSEGKNKHVIDAISKSIEKTPGCLLLDVDSGEATNRTVYTFVGDPKVVVSAALSAAVTAYDLIDMTHHEGEHPRMGALDVCPFIPVKNVTMEECIACSLQFAEQLAEKLKVPVYLYGFSAKEEKRRALPSIRAGEYENMAKKLQDKDWKPDFGPTEFVPSWGATATGCRNFLIAYNVNLLSTKEQSHKIALDLRESGRGKSKPGKLKKVQAVGWYLDEYGLAQVSANLTDYEVTSLHDLFEEVKIIAEQMKIPVVGSQIVGLVPLKCMMLAADYYIKKESLFMLEESDKIRLVINRLGLSSISYYDPSKRIIDYVVRNEETDCPLASTSLKNFIKSVGSRSSAPGGGSVAGVVGALGAALATMAGLLTYGKKQWESLDGVMREIIPVLHGSMEDLIPLIDEDTKAFDSYMIALKLPKNTEEEIARRKSALHEGILEAIRVPQQVLETINRNWLQLLKLADHVNVNCLSDVQVGAKCLETGAWGAYQNMVINLKNIEDGSTRDSLRSEADKELDVATKNCKAVLDKLLARN